MQYTAYIYVLCKEVFMYHGFLRVCACFVEVFGVLFAGVAQSYYCLVECAYRFILGQITLRTAGHICCGILRTYCVSQKGCAVRV